MNFFLTFLTGIFVSLMIYFNGTLKMIIGTELSLLFIHATAFIVILSTFLFKRENKKSSQIYSKRNPLYLCAGLLGILVVIFSNKLFSIGGVLLTLSGTLVGQSIFAFILEVYNRKHIKVVKSLSLLLITSGSVLLCKINDLSFTWIFISWIPGFLLFIQSYMNSRNSSSYGYRQTLIFHFGTVLVVLIPFLFFKRAFSPINLNIIMETSFINLYSGGLIATLVIFLSSMLFIKLKPMNFVLIINIGQLIGAVIIDSYLNIDFSYTKLFVIIITISGFFLNEFNINKLNTGKIK